MEDLEAGLAEDASGVRVFARIFAECPYHRPGRGRREETTLGIGVDVELNLSDPLLRELLGQWRMGVIEALSALGIACDEHVPNGRRGRDVVRVVRADDLNLVESRLIRPGKCARGQRGDDEAQPAEAQLRNVDAVSCEELPRERRRRVRRCEASAKRELYSNLARAGQGPDAASATVSLTAKRRAGPYCDRSVSSE